MIVCLIEQRFYLCLDINWTRTEVPTLIQWEVSVWNLIDTERFNLTLALDIEEMRSGFVHLWCITRGLWSLSRDRRRIRTGRQ